MLKGLSAVNGREMVDATIKSQWSLRRIVMIFLVTLSAFGAGRLSNQAAKLHPIVASSVQSETTTTTTHVAPLDVSTINMTTMATNETTGIVSAVDSQSSLPLQEQSGPMCGARSVLRYGACCGLGHRLFRQAAAYDAAHRLGYQFQVDWGVCGENGVYRDVFSALFREETEAELATYAHSRNQYYKISNEVPGAYSSTKNCVADEMESNYNFYKELKTRFRGNDKVDNFVQQHFHNKFSLGIHIRDGNGEHGDFVDKQRQIKVTPKEWTQRVAKKIVEIIEHAKNHTPDLPSPVLFVATDNARYIGLFQTQLEEQGIPVVQWEQEHLAEGTGIVMGQQDGDDIAHCLQKWMDQLFDTILLGSTDVLIAGQYSSFSQAVPMHLAFGKHLDERKVEKIFCEIINEGTEMDCYKNQMEWCMNTRYNNAAKTWNIPEGSGWTEFLARMPKDESYRNFSHDCVG